MTNRIELEKQLQQELKNCLLLEEEDKKYWLDNISTIPLLQLEAVLKAVKEKNTIVEGYIDTALANDPEKKHLSALKAKVAAIKQEAFAIDQQAQGEEAEQILEKELKNI